MNYNNETAYVETLAQSYTISYEKAATKPQDKFIEMDSYIINKIYPLTEEDKCYCGKLVDFIMNLQKEGSPFSNYDKLLKAINESNYKVLKKGLQLIERGISFEYLKNILQNYIISSEKSKSELLEMILQSIFILHLRDRQFFNFNNLYYTLKSYLGYGMDIGFEPIKSIDSNIFE